MCIRDRKEDDLHFGAREFGGADPFHRKTARGMQVGEDRLHLGPSHGLAGAGDAEGDAEEAEPCGEGCHAFGQQVDFGTCPAAREGAQLPPGAEGTNGADKVLVAARAAAGRQGGVGRDVSVG